VSLKSSSSLAKRFRRRTLDDIHGFYRHPHKDFWGRIGIDATIPMDRKDEFIRKSVPAVDDINLQDYIKLK